MVLFLEKFASIRLHFVAEIFEFLLREICRHQLIRPFSDLSTYGLKSNVFPELRECSLPSSRIEINRVNYRTINIENHCFDHVCPLAIEESGNRLKSRELNSLGVTSDTSTCKSYFNGFKPHDLNTGALFIQSP